MTDGVRLLGATVLLVAWLLLLLIGHPSGLAVHLLLAGALLMAWNLWKTVNEPASRQSPAPALAPAE